MIRPLLLCSIPLLSAVLSAQQSPAATQPPVDFNRDIRPLLADRCFQCHGADRQARKGDLRLDTEAGLTTPIEGRRPVVASDSRQSEVARRIFSHDPKEMMPPPNSDLKLSSDEKDLLVRWIDEGAVYERHWAFLPPVERPSPKVSLTTWPRGEIDRFVLAQLEKRGLSPSSTASPETLIRRVTLDLTGLPPSPLEIDVYLADTAAGAYGRLVDRLLASPHFGERMALVWLDAARYADTNGFHHDNTRTAWPYRDWVIRAFNENMPFDQFVVEQLAGDLLENATDEQRIATAFCRMHNINDEGGALDPEYRVEAIADRIETISTTMMGLTFTCARCHDHKYDPFTQEDYYSLFAYFNSVDERGVYPNNGEQARAYPARLNYKSKGLAQRIEATALELAEVRVTLAGASPEIDAERRAWEAEYRKKLGLRWADTELVEVRSAAGAKFVRKDDGSVLFRGDHDEDSHTFVLHTGEVGMRLVRFEALTDPSLPLGSLSLASHGNAVVSGFRAHAISVSDPSQRQEIEWQWAWADREQANGDFDIHNALQKGGGGWALAGHLHKTPRTAILLAKEPFGFVGGTRVEVTVDYRSRYGKHIVGRPRVSLATGDAGLLAAFSTVTSDWWLAGPFRSKTFDVAYDTLFGPEKEARFKKGQRFGKQAWKHRPKLRDAVVNKLSGANAAFYFGRTLYSPTERSLHLSLGSDDSIRVYLNGKELHSNRVMRGAQADQEKVAITLQAGENFLVIKVINGGGPGGFYYRGTPAKGDPSRLQPLALIPQSLRDAALDQRFVSEWNSANSKTFSRIITEVRAVESKLKGLENEAVPVIVMKELPKPNQAYVLDRGAYDGADKKRPVSRRPPAAIAVPLPEGASDDRLGFARWLTRPDHPLTGRVHMNRLWQMMFGNGIVASLENFGQQSEWPSHPALLDWLALRFVRSGWDQKAMIREIVTSATYRQSAVVSAAAKAEDPQNRLLAWFPRRRLQGELVRDAALFVSGLLAPKVGGPSVKPYQPPGLWREVSIGGSSNTQIFKQDTGDALYRRSLYTFWKRTSPSPQMTTFDAPTREFCVVSRNTTNTPLQALVMWNGVQFVEAARQLAQRTLAESSSDADRLVRMFRRCTGRQPSKVEQTLLKRTLRGFLQRYGASPEDAKLLLQLGESSLPKTYDSSELAAWTMLANALLSLDETIVRD